MGPRFGKTTLLNLIAGLDQPTSGRIVVAGSDVGAMSEGARAAWRARTIGFVFQTYNLMPVLTARENVELPLLLTKLSGADRKRRALTALKVVGLEERVDPPAQLRRPGAAGVDPRAIGPNQDHRGRERPAIWSQKLRTTFRLLGK